MSEFKVSEKQFNDLALDLDDKFQQRTDCVFCINDKKLDAHNTFNLFDKKGNGQVSTKELGNIFKSLALQIPADRLKEWADEVDEEALGYIVWENFKELFERKLKEDEDERELREAFRVLDKQNKGTIPVDDLRWILQSLGDDLTEEELDDMINETDTDGSGTVDYEEFKSLMTSD